MRRFLAITVILSSLLFSAYHAGVWGGFSHAAHTSMGGAADCMMGGCPSEGMPKATDCAAHCLASAGSERDVVPPLAAALIVIAAVLATALAARSLAARFAPLSEEDVGIFLRHRSLATIVLRN